MQNFQPSFLYASRSRPLGSRSSFRSCFLAHKVIYTGMTSIHKTQHTRDSKYEPEKYTPDRPSAVLCQALRPTWHRACAVCTARSLQSETQKCSAMLGATVVLSSAHALGVLPARGRCGERESHCPCRAALPLLCGIENKKLLLGVDTHSDSLTRTFQANPCIRPTCDMCGVAPWDPM